MSNLKLKTLHMGPAQEMVVNVANMSIRIIFFRN